MVDTEVQTQTPTPPPDTSAVTAMAPPDLNGLQQPGPTFAGAVQGSMAPYLQKEQEAIQKAAALANEPPPPPPPHARLLAMIQGIGAGLSGFGTALATHGREGGAKEVSEIQGEEQQQKIQKQQAATAQKNQQIQQQLMVANTNHTLAQNVMLLATLKNELTKSDLQVQGGKLDVIGRTQDIRTKALQDFTMTGDLDAYNDTLRQLGTPAGAASAGTPVSGSVPGTGNPVGATATAPNASAPNASAPNATVSTAGAPAASAPGSAAAPVSTIPPVAMASWKNSVDAAVSAYPNDSAIKQYAAILADQNSTSKQMAMAANAAKNRMGALDTGVKSRQEQESADANSLVGKLSTPEALAAPGAQAAIQAKIADPTTSPADVARLQLLLPRAAVAQSNAEAIKAREERTQQAISQGDPNAAGKLLASRVLTLEELKSRQVTSQFINAALAAALKIDPTYKAPEASAQSRIAASPANAQFFGNTDSLLIRGGTLDQLLEAGNHISQNDWQILNKTKNWAELTTGNSGISAYAMKAIGVADDFAKVIGGGAGTDTARATVMGAIDPKLSPAQRASSVDAARGVVESQRNGRVGTNPYMKDMYPDPSLSRQTLAPLGSPASKVHANLDDFVHQFSGAKGTIYSDDGNTWFDASGNPVKGK
jgi:hypothetical protein